MLGIIHSPEKFSAPTLVHSLISSPLSLLLRTLYNFFTSLHTESANPDPISIVCLADTHDLTPDIPFADILIHAGDLTSKGTPNDIQAQIDWLDSLPHTHKIAIAGNHDYALDPRAWTHVPETEKPPPRDHNLPRPTIDWKGIRYLQHSSVTLRLPHTERSVKVYGAPHIPTCGPAYFAFQYAADQDAWSGTVPDDTHVLVTHTPPKYHLDLAPRPLGCAFLAREVWRVRPLLHVFGHVHVGSGTQVVAWDRAQRVYERAVARAEQMGFFGQILCFGLWIEVGRLLWFGTLGLVWRYVWGSRTRTTRMVNAGVIGKSGLAHHARLFDI